MNATALSRHTSLLLAICVAAFHATHCVAQTQPQPKTRVEPSTPESEAQQRRDQRRQFQSQELITAKSEHLGLQAR